MTFSFKDSLHLHMLSSLSASSSILIKNTNRIVRRPTQSASGFKSCSIYSTSVRDYMSSFMGAPLAEISCPGPDAPGTGPGGAERLRIEAGGGPRTFPGGVTKWQWKRAQEKKARKIERSVLNKEREDLEAKRREQRRLIDGPEKPWENQRTRKISEALLVPVPDVVVDRFRKARDAPDLWNENDGPVGRVSHETNPRSAGNGKPSFVLPGGQDSARDWPENPAFQPGFYNPKEGTKPGPTSSAVSQDTSVSGEKRKAKSSTLKDNGGKTVPSTSASGGGSGAGKKPPTDVSFASFPLSPQTLKALHEDLGYHFCTPVQAQTLPHLLQGKDVLAKAKTGTGKTIAFLLPTIEAILSREKAERAERTANPMRKLPGSSRPIRAIVISPTRELACQLAEEAKILVSHIPGFGVQVVIGGVNMNRETNRLAKEPCQILVGTPGRLLDHLQSPPQLQTDILQRVQGLDTLILDEADTLLDMGFRKPLEKILSFLGGGKMGRGAQRQTVMVSATLSPEVLQIAREALKADHAFVDTVGEETSTNLQVSQQVAMVAMEKQFSAIFSLLKKHSEEEPNYKVMVFSTTARQTELLAALFGRLGVPSLEIHSRKSQAYRTRVSEQFRISPGKVVMFTSDVSARGVDYPDVTLVIQVGVPSERAQYIHRLGRTGRAGKEGQGVLVLNPWETFFLKELKDLPVKPCELPAFDPDMEKKVNAALEKVEAQTKARAYVAWLGFYNGVKGTKWDKVTLVKHANLYSSALGLRSPPAIQKKSARMMGLANVPGITLE